VINRIPLALLFGLERPGPLLRVGSLKNNQIEEFESKFVLRRRSPIIQAEPPITKVIPDRPLEPVRLAVGSSRETGRKPVCERGGPIAQSARARP
jgi:hypothetical protein